MQAKEKTTAE